jgi:hypothetical protein
MFGGLEETVAAALEAALQQQQGRSFVTTVANDRFEKWILDSSSKEWQNSFVFSPMNAFPCSASR